jgi:hypothetical protein
LIDPAYRVFIDTFEDAVEMDFRVEAVKLGRAEQRVDGDGTFSAGVQSVEEIVLATEIDDAFGGVVVDLRLPVVREARPRRPLRDGCSESPQPCRTLGESLASTQPCMKVDQRVWSVANGSSS